jgi:hypothetical protein
MTWTAANPLRPGVYIVTSWCWSKLWVQRDRRYGLTELSRLRELPVIWHDVLLELKMLEVMKID